MKRFVSYQCDFSLELSQNIFKKCVITGIKVALLLSKSNLIGISSVIMISIAMILFEI